MPDDIERTIYKLELDGSAYIEGVDKVTNSTKKLSEAQEASNKKLIELKTQQASYEKQLLEIDGVLKANEKETLDLTKRLNDLKAAEKGASVEAKNLQAQLRANAINTKEFRIEQAALKTSLASTNTSLKAHTVEMKAAEAASGGFAKGATKAFSALRSLANLIPGIGIGGLVALIAGPLVSAFSKWAGSIDTVNQKQNLLKDSFTGGEYQTAIKDISALTLNVKLAQQGFLDKDEVLKQYNDTLGKSLGHVTDLDQAEDNLVKKGPAYIQMTLLKAAANLALDKAAQQAVEAAIDLQESQDRVIDITKKGESQADIAAGAGGLSEFLASGLKNEAVAAKQEADKGIERLKTIAEEFQKDAALIAKQFGIDFDPQKQTKTKLAKSAKEITNIYAQELQKLKADIAKLDEKGFTNEESITKAIEADFKIRSDAFVKAFKNKQLTAPQLAALQGYLKNLQDLTLNAQLKSFRDQRANYLQAISDEITNLQIEESTKRIQTLQDSFERERQTIINETDKTVSVLEQKRDKRIDDIIKNAAKSGLTLTDVAPQIQQIKDVYSKLLDDLQIIKNQKLQQLAFDTFEALTQEAKRALDAENLGISQGSLFRIRQEAELFQQGKISFNEYQQALTEIARNEAQERFVVESAFLKLEIKLRQTKLAEDKTLTDAQIKRLRDEIRRLEQQLADAEKGNITGGITDPGKDNDKLKNLVEYANAIKDLTDSIISFWQQSNEAEQKALDRSIALQEKRVDAALRIAERGNAQYLKAEQDRLTELNLQRENAARKQLGIDAALQASQILVGITGAISHIATPGIGVAQTIAEIAVIVGALATGFSIVKSLQGNQPKLYKGTKYLERDGAPAGRDTIPVMAHEGEAVIPADTNKRYGAAVAAIYDNTIPAEDLNRFVTTYHKIKPVPQVDYRRIGEAAMINIEQDGRMSVLLSDNNKKLDESNELSKLTLQAMKKMSVSASIDKDGVAIMVNEWVQKSERDKKI